MTMERKCVAGPDAGRHEGLLRCVQVMFSGGGGECNLGSVARSVHCFRVCLIRSTAPIPRGIAITSAQSGRAQPWLSAASR